MFLLSFLIGTTLNYAAEQAVAEDKSWSVETGWNKTLFNNKNDDIYDLLEYYYYTGYNSLPRFAFEEASGFYLKLEKVLDNHLSLEALYSFSMSGTLSFFDETYYDTYYNSYTNKHRYQLYIHSLEVGANWYIISANLSNKFTPYVGLNFDFTYSLDYDDVSSLDHRSDKVIELEQVEEMGVAIVPKIGISIPVFSDFSLKLETKYNISVYNYDMGDIGFPHRSHSYRNYFQFNLGLKYNF